ncbi:MAG: hypothetical protein ACXVPY_10395 [Bacteroidia bacterium]
MKTPNRITLIKGINTPFSFFALALLIVESFLGLIILKSDIDHTNKIYLIYFGGFLFILETSFVFYLILKNKVRDLTFDKEAHLKSEQRKTGGSF